MGATTTDGQDMARRVPTVLVAAGVFVGYVVVVVAIQWSSGVPYTEYFSTTGTAWRAGALSLAVGVVILLGFQVWRRWDGIWRDQVRLPANAGMHVAVGLFVLLAVVRLVAADWAAAGVGLVVALVVCGVLVGFCEETLFRGFVLRALRQHRTELVAVLLTSLWFGAMHLVNALTGQAFGTTLVQAVLAALSGVVLYLARRTTGLLVAAMVAHGLWDFSLFLPAGGPPVLGLLMTVLTPVIGLLALVSVLVAERGAGAAGRASRAVAAQDVPACDDPAHGSV